MVSVLIVEDEVEIAEMMKFILKREGYDKIDMAHTFQEGCDLAQGYDTYILDINLPDGSGYALAERIRKKSDAPILYVSANVTDEDKLTGFATGADDYITKPFNPLLLAARVKANIDRYMRSKQVLDFFFDERTAELTVKDKVYHLSGKQYLLMQYLFENQNKVLTKEEIYEAVWDNQFIDENTVMVHIRKLREKIEEVPSHPVRLMTVRSVGYILKVERN
ncbi:response regulator transcription factor [Macrococcus hajekii]|uniref:Response regulator transcription factor n=1 Tax=Macrococcus hajekii TaxID=198482 RepID=A0A4R6BHS2_9STAP|nr:response regulator transcription factor [Macrococcus hajekii]TDM01133.1 response regulator transcription factor [Macrococcus hajekii]GGB12199.1 DNA-binding response regulator [Macrococcus hajekii]